MQEKGRELGSKSIQVVLKQPHPPGYSLSIAFGAPEDGRACKHPSGIAER